MSWKFKKLLKGIALFTLFQLYDKYVGVDGLHKMIKAVQLFFDFLQGDLASIIANLFGLIVNVAIAYCAISGVYRIISFNQFIPSFDKQ